MTGTSAGARVSGILNIDKPYGATSMDVVRVIRRACAVKRVGHGGTLDPIATGVVPVAVGQATRTLEYLLGGSKEYTARIELGVSTDTHDAMGSVTSERDASGVDRVRVESALEEFRGEIAQVPPMHSALKRGGKRLYELARRGVEVEREARPVVVHEIALDGWEPPVAIVSLTCGSGFYVRSLARDLGDALGCGGHMQTLVRRRCGPFRLEDSVSPDEARDAFEAGRGDALLHPPDAALASMRAIVVDARGARMLRNGRALPRSSGLASGTPGERARAYGADGGFLAIARFDGDAGVWRPDKVFAG